MAKSNRYTFRYIKHNMDRWFRTRQRIFLYHYVSDPVVDVEWKDLASTGCRYVGWLPLDHRTRGEIWLYPTEKHRTMVQMLIPPRHLLWKKQFMRVRHERRKADRMHADQIRQAIKRNGEFWFFG